MIAVAWLLLLAAIGYGIAHGLRLPVVPALVATGIIMSLSGSASHAGLGQNFVEQIIELGLAFLLFSSGVELTPARFRRQTRQVLWVAVIQFAALSAAGYAAAILLGYDSLTSVYIAAAISASSTLVVLRTLRDQAQMYEPYGRMVTGVVLLQDFAIIALLAAMAGIPHGVSGVALSIGGLAIIFALSFIAHRWVVPALILKLRPDDEVLLLLAIAVLFSFLGIAHAIGAPILAGAFFAGFALSAFPVNGLLRGLLSSLSDFFLAIFFIALGLLVRLPTSETLTHAILLSALILIITPPVVAAVAEWHGASSRSAIESGLILSQSSEFALVLGFAGLATNQIDIEIFSMIALVAVITMTMTPFLANQSLAWRLLRFHPGWRRSDTTPKIHNHVLMLGFGSAGMWIAKPLREAGKEVLVVDDDPVVIEQLQQLGIPCLRGDASDEKVLQTAGAQSASLILSSVPRTADVLKILSHLDGDVPVIARTLDSSDAQRIEDAGGTAVRNSEAAADAFMQWFEATAKT